MRQGLRAAAETASNASKSSVLGPPPGGGGSARPGLRRSTGLRAGLAKGVKVSIRSGREAASGAVTGEGVRVIAGGNGLTPQQAPMLKAYMAASFRHPVFNHGWVTQQGKNWFYRPLRQGRPQYQSAIVEAIETASRAVANG